MQNTRLKCLYRQMVRVNVYFIATKVIAIHTQTPKSIKLMLILQTHRIDTAFGIFFLIPSFDVNYWQCIELAKQHIFLCSESFAKCARNKRLNNELQQQTVHCVICIHLREARFRHSSVRYQLVFHNITKAL